MMQNAAVLWHVSLLVAPEDKGLALGLVGLVKFIPIVVFSLISGVVADALDRRKLMLLTQSGMTLIAAIMAWITYRGLDDAWPIYVLTGLSSAVGAFDGPARQSLVPALVPARHFPNAISLNTIMFHLASVIGPWMAGETIARWSVGTVYVINALSFVAVIVALLAMRDVPERAASSRTDISLRSAIEGLKFVFHAPMIRSTMLLDFFATFFSSATALLPIFAQDILAVGPQGYGRLSAAPAVGALVAAAIMVPSADRIVHRGRVLVWAVVAYGAATILFGLSRDFLLTFTCLAATGAADTVSMVLRNIIRQLGTPDEMRGRMTSVNMIFFMGGPQLGEFEAGTVANWLGATFSVVSGGIGCLIATAAIAWRTPGLMSYRREETAPTSTD
jgi:MFS family permease